MCPGSHHVDTGQANISDLWIHVLTAKQVERDRG